MHRVIPCLLMAFLATAFPAVASESADPTGLWWAEGGAAQVEIVRCGEALCGRVVWLRSPFDEHGCPLRDEYNPDPSLRQRSVVGVELLRELRLTAEGEWGGGEIYDPGSGRTYSAVLHPEGENRLQLRGYLGLRLLGRTTTWVRVGTELQCREPA